MKQRRLGLRGSTRLFQVDTNTNNSYNLGSWRLKRTSYWERLKRTPYHTEKDSEDMIPYWEKLERTPYLTEKDSRPWERINVTRCVFQQILRNRQALLKTTEKNNNNNYDIWIRNPRRKIKNNIDSESKKENEKQYWRGGPLHHLVRLVLRNIQKDYSKEYRGPAAWITEEDHREEI